MKRELKLKNPEDYEGAILKELEYYLPLAKQLSLSDDVLLQAARLGVRDGIYRHRESSDCRNREEDCVRWNIRHMVDITLVRAALLASTEEDMAQAEDVLLKLIED
jgi:hypothetical protein